jgi:hypothetical protein
MGSIELKGGKQPAEKVMIRSPQLARESPDGIRFSGTEES